MDKVKWGIIGIGDVCEVKSGPPLYMAEGSEVVNVMRRNAQKAMDFASRHQLKKWTSDAKEILEDPEINAVYIATPPDSHAYYTHLAAEAGKHVYVEKPIARTYDEAKAMVQSCDENNVKLFVAYYRRYLPNFLFIRDLLENYKIGKVLSVNILLRQSIPEEFKKGEVNSNHWRIDPKISGGGYFYDLASHQLDMMDYLFGPIKYAKGVSRNIAGSYEADDYTSGTFEFESGLVGNGEWNFCVPHYAEKEMTTIFGEKGTITFPFFGDHSVTTEINGIQEKHLFDMPKHIQFPLIQSIVNDLLGAETCNSVGTSAARTNLVMEWLTH